MRANGVTTDPRDSAGDHNNDNVISAALVIPYPLTSAYFISSSQSLMLQQHCEGGIRAYRLTWSRTARLHGGASNV